VTTVIKLKRGTSTPTTSDLASGEVAIDTAAQKFYVNDAGTVKKLGGADSLNELSDVFYEGQSLGIGTDALRDKATNGQRNIGIGYRAALQITAGDDNVAIGHDAMLQTDGDHSFNTFVGSQVGQDRVGGDYNTAIGYESQGGSVASGDNNTSLGARALKGLQGGHSNVGIGRDAGDSITSGFQNTCIGMDAGETISGGDNNTCIGYNAQASGINVNNEITLGDTNITSLRIPGLQSGASSGDVLTFDGTDIGLATPSSTLAGNSDVTFTSLTEGDEIVYDGTEWVNKSGSVGIKVIPFVKADASATTITLINSTTFSTIQGFMNSVVTPIFHLAFNKADGTAVTTLAIG